MAKPNGMLGMHVKVRICRLSRCRSILIVIFFYNLGLGQEEAKLRYIALAKTVLSEMMSQSLELFSMSQTVKNVLPQVPLDVIRRDLIITSNVDETITR